MLKRNKKKRKSKFKTKNPHVNAEDLRDAGSVPGSRRSPEGGNGNPLQNSCQENPMDRGAWQTTVHRVAKSDMTEATQHGTYFNSF